MAASELGLTFHIKSESSVARADITGLRAHVAKETAGITAGFSGAQAPVLSLGSAFRTVRDQAGQLHPMIASLVNPLTSLTAAAGALFGVLYSSLQAQEKLIKDAIEAGSRINDLSIKTGLYAETLSGLDTQLKESGTTLEKFSDGVFFLQKNLLAASEGNKNLQQTFAKLGIKDTTAAMADMDATLRKVLQGLFNIREEGIRNAVGAQVMGKAYKELSVFMDDTGGNIDAVIEKAREMGLVMSGETASAADRLGDAMERLNARSDALKRQMGEKFFPIMQQGMELFEANLVATKRRMDEWAESALQTGNVLNWVAKVVLGIKDSDVAQARRNMGAGEIADAASRAAAQSRQGGFTPTATGGGSTKSDPRIKELERQEKEAERIYKQETAALKDEYDRRRINLIRYTEELVALENKLFEDKKAIIQRQRALAKPGERGKFDTEITAAGGEKDANVMKAWHDAEKQLLSLKRELEEKVLDLDDEFDRRDIAAIRARVELEEGVLFQSAKSKEKLMISSEARIAEIEEAAAKRRIDALEKAEDELIAAAAGKDKEAIQEKLRRLREDQTLTVEQVAEFSRDVALARANANQEELARLDAQIVARRQKEQGDAEDRERRIADEEARKLAREKRYQDAMSALENEHAANQRRLEIEEIESLNRKQGFDIDRHDRLLILYQREEAARHDGIEKQLEDDERAAKKSIETLLDAEERKLEIHKLFSKLHEDEARRYNDELERIRQASDEKKRSESIEGLNPFGQAGTEEFIKSGDVIKGAFADIKQMGLDAFGALAQGFGQMVGAWASGANLGANAMRKLLGSILAGIAAQATTAAVLFTGYGIASLTPWGSVLFGPPGPWFAAAAVMAGIGVGSALLGRAISPREATAGSSQSSGASASGGQGTRSDETREITIERNRLVEPEVIAASQQPQQAQQPQEIHLYIHSKVNPDAVIEHFVSDYRSNGRTRVVINSDGTMASA